MARAFSFDGEVIIVTGAGGGLGRDYALQFAARGGSIVVHGRPGTPGGGHASRSVRETVEMITSSGGSAVSDCSDITTPFGAAELVDKAVQTFGRLDILINNAGIIEFVPFDELTPDQWLKMQKITLDAPFYTIKAAWPVFRAAGHGRIINTTSNSGYAGHESLAHYGAMKMAIVGLTKCLALEGAAHAITVNAVAPMAITAMNRKLLGATSFADTGWAAAMAKGDLPIGPPKIVSPTVLWLAHRSTTVNGAILASSSGKVARVETALSGGYFDPVHSPEDLQQNADKVLHGEGLVIVDSPFDEIEDIHRLFNS